MYLNPREKDKVISYLINGTLFLTGFIIGRITGRWDIIRQFRK
jgi:hypothetical protein